MTAVKRGGLANSLSPLPCDPGCGNQKELASGAKSSNIYSQKSFNHLRQTSESPLVGQTTCKEVKCLYIDTAASIFGCWTCPKHHGGRERCTPDFVFVECGLHSSVSVCEINTVADSFTHSILQPACSCVVLNFWLSDFLEFFWKQKYLRNLVVSTSREPRQTRSC